MRRRKVRTKVRNWPPSSSYLYSAILADLGQVEAGDQRGVSKAEPSKPICSVIAAFQGVCFRCCGKADRCNARFVISGSLFRVMMEKRDGQSERGVGGSRRACSQVTWAGARACLAGLGLRWSWLEEYSNTSAGRKEMGELEGTQLFQNESDDSLPEFKCRFDLATRRKSAAAAEYSCQYLQSSSG